MADHEHYEITTNYDDRNHLLRKYLFSGPENCVGRHGFIVYNQVQYLTKCATSDIEITCHKVISTTGSIVFVPFLNVKNSPQYCQVEALAAFLTVVLRQFTAAQEPHGELQDRILSKFKEPLTWKEEHH